MSLHAETLPICPRAIIGAASPELIVIGIIAVFVILGIIGAQQERKRVQALRRLSKRLGLAFSTDHDHGFDDRFPQFSWLRDGKDRYAFNVMSGRRGNRAVWAFDYHYETESTDSDGDTTTTNHYFSAVILDSMLPLKPLAIRPETFSDRLAEFLGFDDIDFESNEFSRQFHVSSPDRKWAFDVISQETMEFLLSMPAFPIELHGNLVTVEGMSQFDPAEFVAAIEVIEGILDRLPTYLLRELKGVHS